jgi:Flp pilus assembly protein protease CpaA
MFEQISYVFALTVLSYASICDLKTREVSNKLWMIVWPAGFTLSALNIILGDLTVSTLALSAGISTILGIATAYFGLFGGADMKALIFIGLTVPAYPEGMRVLFGDPIGIPAVTVIMNAYIFCMIYPPLSSSP